MFGLPVAGLSILAVLTIFPVRIAAFWPWISVELVTVCAAVAVFAGWWLIIKALRGGANALRGTNCAVWIGASFGVLLVLAAVASRVLESSPEYSAMAIFREHLEVCVLGAPLIIMLAHLWAEARFRRS